MTATTFGAGSLVGVPVRRVEDPTLLRGQGTYIDNLPIEGVLHLAFVRSPIAHATIRSIDLSEARAMPGVVAVYSADDLDFPNHTAMMQLHPAAIRPALARDKVRYVGDAVVVVVAETKAQAVDAAEAVIVDYDPLPAVADMESAMDADSPLQFDAIGSNVIMGAREPDGYDPLAGADVIVRGRFENQRLAVVPMEGAAVAVIPGDDGDGHQLTVYLGCQMPHMNRGGLAAGFGLEPDSVRLIAPNVGGSFGAKHWAPEDIVAVKVALELGRPVKWVETRSENMMSMPHGRGQVQYIELGLRNDGTIVGLRCRIIGDSGAYGGFGGMLSFGPTRMMSQGVYRIPDDRVRRRGGAHQPGTDGRVPRRGPARGGRHARTHHRHGRGGAGDGPRRHPTPQLPASRRVPLHDRHRRHLRHRQLRRRAHRGAAHRRLRGAARRAGGPACARRRPAARDRHRGLRRDHRRRLRQRVLRGRGPQRRHAPR